MPSEGQKAPGFRLPADGLSNHSSKWLAASMINPPIKDERNRPTGAGKY